MRYRDKLYIQIIAISAVLFFANTAFAGDSGSVATMDEPTHIMSVTVAANDLLHFSSAFGFDPFVQITAEFKAHEKWGLALIGGLGTTTAKSDIVGSQHFNAWDLGGQFRYYLLGDFDHGMQLGGEALYVNVYDEKAAGVQTGNMSRVRQAIGVGPFVGYKIAASVGFTFEAQLGIQRTFALSEAEAVAGETADAPGWGPLLNLNVGWSF